MVVAGMHFGAEIFQIYPNRCPNRRGHGGLPRAGQLAAKRFNHHLRQALYRYFFVRQRPSFDRDLRVAMGRHPSQRAGVIDKQSDGLAAARQLRGQAPSKPDISVVIDDTTKHSPLLLMDFPCHRDISLVNLDPCS